MSAVQVPPVAVADAVAGRREWAGLAVLVGACVFVSMDVSVLFYAVPALSRDLEPSSTEVLWILDAYGFLLAGLLITMGVLGDRFGRRRMLMAGAALFGGASVAAAYSGSAAALIVCRALMGVGAAMLAPSTLALISTMFRDRTQRRTAIAVWSAAFAAGSVLGPVLGGVLLAHFWWGSVLLANIVVAALLLGAGPALLPEAKDPAAGRIDPLSVVLSMAAILPVVYGVKLTALDGAGLPGLAALGVGAAAGAAFVVRQLRLAHPLLDLALFRRREFGAGILANGTTQFALMGLTLLAAQYLQGVLGLTALTAALWMVPSVAGVLTGLALAGRLAPRLRPGTVVGFGLVTAAAGCLIAGAAGHGLGLLVTGATLTGIGVGAVALPATDIVLAAAPPERAGAASAVAETSTELGAALGIATLGTLSTVLFSARLPVEIPGTGAGFGAGTGTGTGTGTATGSGTLTEALHAAQQHGPEALAAVHTAFTDSLRLTLLAATVLLLGTATAAFLALRAVRLGESDDGEQAEQAGQADQVA
ncbi:MFS transporter [Streptomyces sp. NPDC048659]|uniref:MFS transporter n=1 Tax=Streptomyces sp. NPDC048659 TaxID=3155489 RepID=UPI00341AD4DA